MEGNVWSRLSTPRMMFVTVTAVIGLMLTVHQTDAVPQCDWQIEITDCSIKDQSDFAALPTNVTSLRVYFLANHQAVLSARAFPLRPNLRTLIIDLNNINDDPQGNVFSQLTELRQLTVINRDKYAPRELKLPAMAFMGLKNLRMIKMSRVGLLQVDQTTFHILPSLEKLDVSENDLTAFPGAAFTGTTNIVELDFSHNKLSAIIDGTFNGLAKLQNLNLDHNKLRVLSAATFGNLPALGQLMLANNNLRSVGLGTFQNLPLQTLQLQNNKLKQIDANIFNGLSSLNNLDISQNNLTEIADLAFTDLTNLQFLEIFKNLLKEISPLMLRGLRNLAYLDLHANDFTDLKDDIFRDLTELSTLNLHNSKIQRVSVGTFKGLSAMHLLTLQDNSITTLPEGVFDGLDNLAFVDISNNPLNCTCTFTWIHDWIDGKNLGSEKHTQCASDGEALLQYARDNYYNCRRTTTTTTTTTTTSPVTTTKVLEDSTTASLVKLSSSVEPGYRTNNGSAFLSASLNQTDLIILICVASVAFILAVFIAVLIIYCRQKKCAFWTPEPVSTIPVTQGRLEKENHFAYSPTKDQSFFGDQAEMNLDRKAKTGSIRIDRHHPLDSAYDNPALYVEDANPNHHHPADPAVVAYISENGVMQGNGQPGNHSYEHRVSDSGTHYVDRIYPSAPTDDIYLNDLSPPEVNAETQPKSSKKEKKRKHGKKSKKASVSSSSNGEDNLYQDVYAPATDIPPSTMTPPMPAPRPSLQKRQVYDTSMDYIGHGLERDSALGASTEEPFEDQPSRPGLETDYTLSDPASRNTDNSPHYVDHAHHLEGNNDEDVDSDHRRLQHTDSLGVNSDYMDYNHAY